MESKANYTDGRRQGTAFFYEPNGLLIRQQDFLNDEPHGSFISFYPNGKKSSEGVHYRGSPTGIWKFYSHDGKLIMTKTYSNPPSSSKHQKEKKN